MTDKEIFNKFADKNFWHDLGVIKLTTNQLEKIILTACRYAREDEFTKEREYRIGQENMRKRSEAANNADILNQIFGGKK